MVDFPHKIRVPHRPPHLVSRSRLTDVICSDTTLRLITLIAPPGYGKTSLLVDFVTSTVSKPVCWYTLDRFDDDPWVFIEYFAAAIEQQFPTATRQTTTLLASRANLLSVATALIRELYAIKEDFVFVLDDWHLVDKVVEIKDFVAQILLHCPQCHLILASRSQPSLPDMMLLLARQQMVGLFEEDLRFTPAEVADVLSNAYRINIPLSAAETATEQANGWITGVLLAYQIHGSRSTEHQISNLRADPNIYRFLAEQVFDRQPDYIQTFLLDSALLEELTADACNTLLERTNSANLLSILQQRHLFITEISPGVLRYHPLFREFLLDRYRSSAPEKYRDMQHRVAAAYLTQRHWSAAFDVYLAAGDLQAVQEVVAAGGEDLYAKGRRETLERWFSVLPLAQLDATLLCLHGRVLTDLGHLREAQALVELAAARMRPHEEIPVRLLQAQHALLKANYETALALLGPLLDLPSERLRLGTALRMAAMSHHRLGNTPQAIKYLHEALSIERQRGDLYAIAALLHNLAMIYEEMGRIVQADEYYNHADAHWGLIGNTSERSTTLNSRGIMQHRMGDYLEAHTTLMAALQYAQEAAVPKYQAASLASLGDLYCDLHLWRQAHVAYTAAQRVKGTAYMMSYLDVARVRLMVLQRQYADAEHAFALLSEMTQDQHVLEVQLLRARLALGLRRYTEVHHCLTEILATVSQMDKPREVARAWLLTAQAASEQSHADSSAMLHALDQAVEIADELGYDAFLLMEAYHSGPLLRRAAAAGWSRASDWLQRQQALISAAQMLGTDPSHPVLVVRTFGPDQLILNGQPVNLGWSKAREVLYYLIAHPQGVPAEVLREEIWPELEGERRGNALKTAVYKLRAVLPDGLIELRSRQLYVLNRNVVEIDDDSKQFLALLDSPDDAERLFAAIELYRGPYLPWSENTWCIVRRQYLEQQYIQALRRTAKHSEESQAYLDALMLYQRLLAIDGLDEAAHAGVMRCYLQVGNRAAAIQQYIQLGQRLDEELGLGIDRTSEIEQLYTSILAAS
jgi:LuxR family maltose regulon positive regulatory protein